jgi:N-acyl-D-amino-acid deacylase
MTNLLIRGGTVVDGTGSPGYRADVRITGGRIAEIGPDLESAEEPTLDAAGSVVTPGFIESHTHVDPSLFWDPLCDPLPQHGVTSVVFGNCGLSLAPVRPEDRAGVTSLFCYVEDLPEDVFNDSITWDWQDYAGYRAASGAGGFAVNAGGLVGHSMLRLWVMGEAAWERAATPTERDEIARLLGESLAGGAIGMSSSLGFDEDRAKRPVPSRLADDAELQALVDVLADHDKILQFIPTPGPTIMDDVQRIVDLTRARGVLSTWINIACLPDRPGLAEQLLDQVAVLQANGARTYPQLSPRTMDIRVNWAGGGSFVKMPEAWHPVVQANADDKRRMLQDPAWRDRARQEWDDVQWTILPHKHIDRVRLIEVSRPENERWLGLTLADLVAERGGHPSDVLADWVLENDLRPGVVGVGVANADIDEVARTLQHPAGIVSNSDAGAHLLMFCAAGDSTLLLTRHVRDRADLTLEHAVWQLSGRQAEIFGFRDRGVLRTGAHADINVFALDELTWEADKFVADLPRGAQRLYRPGGGYRHTIVSGVVTAENGRLTGARPGRFLDGGRDGANG